MSSQLQPEAGPLASQSGDDVPHWCRGKEHMIRHLTEVEAQGNGVAWRESLPAAMAEAKRDGKPVLIHFSCFEHGRVGAPNL